jgi:glyoxylate reductase
MKGTVFIAHPIPETGIDRLRERFEVSVHPDIRPLDASALADKLAGCGGVISLLCDRIDGWVMDQCPDLKIIANHAVGYENIDVAAARERGILVTNTPGVLTAAAAEIAFALLIALTRRIMEADRFTRQGRFIGWDPLLLRGDELAGRTLGIIGMGRIGQDMARKCRAFDMHIIYHNRRPVDPETERALNAEHVSLDNLLARSDAVSIHAPSTPETRRLIDAEALGKMKAGSYLINTARGDIVHEAALVDALSAGRIKGAGLDVYEFEPKVTRGLLDLENVVLLPHIGSATHEARDRMSAMAADNVIAALTGRTPPNRVPETVGH